MKRITSLCLAGLVALAASAALAQQALESLWTGKQSVDPDGDLEEWSGASSVPAVPFALLGGQSIVAGAGPYDGPDDVGAEIAFAHNGKAVFAAIRWTDDVFVRREPRVTIDDHVELWFAAPRRGGDGYDLRGVGLFPDPARGKVDALEVLASPERVGKPIRGARAGIAARGARSDLEVAIPWSAIPGGAKGRRDLRAVAFVIDSDAADVTVHETILGTGYRDLLGAPADMPGLVQSDIGGELRAFNVSVGLPRDLPSSHLVAADICGSRAKEEVQVVDKYVVVLGCNPVSGRFLYHDAPVAGGYGVLALAAAPLLGDGRDALVLRYAESRAGVEREWIEVYSVGADGVFTMVFDALVAVRAPGYTIENAYRLVPGGKAKAIVVSATMVEGEVPLAPPELDGNPMVVGGKPAKYVFDGTRYARQ